jgi:hypothetical protein
MDKYNTLEYSLVKAIMVSVRLRNFLWTIINSINHPLLTPNLVTTFACYPSFA